jgi:hypothetical protein
MIKPKERNTYTSVLFVNISCYHKLYQFEKIFTEMGSQSQGSGDTGLLFPVIKLVSLNLFGGEKIQMYYSSTWRMLLTIMPSFIHYKVRTRDIPLSVRPEIKVPFILQVY